MKAFTINFAYHMPMGSSDAVCITGSWAGVLDTSAIDRLQVMRFIIWRKGTGSRTFCGWERRTIAEELETFAFQRSWCTLIDRIEPDVEERELEGSLEMLAGFAEELPAPVSVAPQFKAGQSPEHSGGTFRVQGVAPVRPRRHPTGLVRHVALRPEACRRTLHTRCSPPRGPRPSFEENPSTNYIADRLIS